MALTLVTTGCAGGSDAAQEDVAATASATADTVTVSAQNGEVEVPAEPQSIVACGYALVTLIQADAPLSASCEWTREYGLMSAQDQATYDALPKVAPDQVTELDYEAVAAADPDLIVMGVPLAAKEQVDMATLETLAPVVFLGPSEPGDWRELTSQWAALAGTDAEAEVAAAKEEYQARAAEVAERWADEYGDLTFAGIDSTEAGTFRREYADSYATNILADLGFTFPGTASGPVSHAENLSTEQLAEAYAGIDVIVYSVGDDGQPKSAALAELMGTELWQQLPAVQAGNLLPLRYVGLSTYETALLALDDVDAGLAALPAAS